MTEIIDTNVILVANGQHAGVTPTCVASCAKRLYAIKTGGRVAIDDSYRILTEYQRKTTPRAGKRAGDVFLKWLLQVKANPERCDQIALSEHSERGFESFPPDSRLASFDAADRVFVAVACAHRSHPPIAQATDSKWLGWAPALHEHEVTVNFLCRADIRAFDDKKKARRAR